MTIHVFEKKKLLSNNANDYLITTINYDDNKKKIIDFSIIQILFEEKPIQIIKYDSSHGYCHAHKYYTTNSNPQEISMEINPKTIKELKEDIQQNWRKYKEQYQKKQRFNNL